MKTQRECFFCRRPATVKAAVGCNRPVPRWRCDEHRRVCDACRIDESGQVVSVTMTGVFDGGHVDGDMADAVIRVSRDDIARIRIGEDVVLTVVAKATRKRRKAR